MSEVEEVLDAQVKRLQDHNRHLQERLTKAERERDEALAALRPFATAGRIADQLGYHALTVVGPDVKIRPEDFARAAELVGDEK